MKMKIACLLFFTSFMVNGQGVLQQFENVLEQGKSEFPLNKVLLKTDKEVYYPGETIWFKADIVNCFAHKPAIEKELIVLIKAETGEVIIDHKFNVENGMVNACMQIPEWMKEGNAFIVAYTPKAMRINDASLAAIQPIVVNRFEKKDCFLQLYFDKSIYKPGEEMTVNFVMRPISTSGKREKLIFSLYDFKTEVFSVKKTVAANENIEFKIKIPNEIYDVLYLSVQSLSNHSISKKKTVPTYTDNIKIEFYPEGGKLLTNHIQRIVYRSTDWYGKPVNISGSIYDKVGNHVGSAKSLKPGYGLIKLMPMPNQEYALIIDGNYQRKKYIIPQLNFNGASFSYIKKNDGNLICQLISTGTVNQQTVTIAAIFKGEVVWDQKVVANNLLKIKIPSVLLPYGILQFVIIDEAGTILSERLVYNGLERETGIRIGTVENEDAFNINVDVDDFQHQFGATRLDIKVADINTLSTIWETTEVNLLKYPLSIESPKTVLDLHLVNIELIANEFKHYSLEKMMSGFELNQIAGNGAIHGTVIDKNGTPVSGISVIASSDEMLGLVSVVSDANGKFVLEGIGKSEDLKVKAFDPSNKKKYLLKLERSFDESLEELILTKSLQFPNFYSWEQIFNYYHRNKTIFESKYPSDKIRNKRQESEKDPNLNSCNDVLDVIKMMKPFYISNNQIVFHENPNSLNFQSGALIVIDGQKMGTNIDAMKCLSPYNIESLNVFTNPSDISRYTALNSVGVIEIKTKHGVLIVENGTTDFNTKFDPAHFSTDEWKRQTTLYWNTNIQPDKNGIFNFDIKPSGIKSDFVIQIDAAAESGIIERKRVLIKVD